MIESAQRWLTIRADATPSTGAGHAMRCLSVAEQWRELGGAAELWGDVSLEFVATRARNGGVEVRSQAQLHGRDLLLVDIYDEAERRRLAREHSHRTRVLVDDLISGEYREFDAVWNPNAYGEPTSYPDTTALAGEGYVPIREGLPRWSTNARGGAVAFGGGSLSNSLRRLVADLPAITRESEGTSVADPAPAGWRRVDPLDPWRSLHSARWLLIAAGSMLWEAAAVGIPVVVCITADNQVHAGGWAERHGAPVFDLRGDFAVDAVATRIAAALRAAHPLPSLVPGARQVASRLWEL